MNSADFTSPRMPTRNSSCPKKQQLQATWLQIQEVKDIWKEGKLKKAHIAKKMALSIKTVSKCVRILSLDFDVL